MHVIAQYVICLALIVIAGALVHLTLGISALVRTVASKRLFSTCGRADTLSYSPAGTPSHGFAIYMYRQGKWHLEADLSTPGCETTPPDSDGAFDGQVIRKYAAPK